MALPFRLGIINDEVSQDIDDVIELAKEYGLSGIELRSVDNKPVHQLSDEEIGIIKDKVESHGMEICALSTPIFKCHLNESEITEHRHILRRSLEIAKQLNVQFIRGFTFWAEKAFDDVFDPIVAELKKHVPYMEEANMILALEPDPAVNATNASKIRKIIDAVQSPYVQALYDPGNNIWDPDGEQPFPYAYETLKDVICHIHLKDAVETDEGPQAVAIGEGNVDYVGLLQRLVDDQYEGYVMVETHYRLKNKLTEEQLKRPSGSDFSAGGMEASRDCLNGLFRVLKQL